MSESPEKRAMRTSAFERKDSCLTHMAPALSVANQALTNIALAGSHDPSGLGERPAGLEEVQLFHSTKLRYDARASIWLGDNLLAIAGIGGSAVAWYPSPHWVSLRFR